jgi:hypothetical protein
MSETERTIPEFQHNFARFLVTCVERQSSFADKAIEMAGLAQAGAPKNADYTSTLGAAHCRAGNDTEAIDWLQKAIALREGGGNAFDHFFLAIATSKTSPQEAKDSYVAGQAWLDDNQPGNLMLHRLAKETRETLGLPEPEPAETAASPTVE